MQNEEKENLLQAAFFPANQKGSELMGEKAT
jgi:hypothetical protein